MLGNIEIDIFQSLEFAVIKIEITHFNGVLFWLAIRHMVSCKFKKVTMKRGRLACGFVSKKDTSKNIENQYSQGD